MASLVVSNAWRSACDDVSIGGGSILDMVGTVLLPLPVAHPCWQRERRMRRRGKHRG